MAEKLAEILRAAGFAVFYDNFYPEHLWGKDLTAFLDEIYRKRAKFCVVFVSTEYKERKWTIHELRSAQAKALEQKGNVCKCGSRNVAVIFQRNAKRGDCKLSKKRAKKEKYCVCGRSSVVERQLPKLISCCFAVSHSNRKRAFCPLF